MNRWVLFAWLGMIRFGMEMFEEALKKLWGAKLRHILQKYTDKIWKATITGTLVTALLNSSTLISLLTLGFVSSGMMSLVSAIAILVGANIGSTTTGLLVSYLGFGEFNIAMFALPLIAIGGGIMIFTSKKYRWYRTRLLIGFGLFFLGIDFLKENLEVISALFNFEQYGDMSLWIFGIIGMGITAVIQSSGAVSVMTLAALSSGIIGFEAGFAIILWANIGTSFTALIASLSGSIAKKQIGIANTLFNIISVMFGIILFYPFIWFTLETLGYKDNLVMGNAMINIIFNIVTSLLFVPFIKPFAKLVQRIIPEKEQVYPLEILKYPLHKQERRYDEDIAAISLNALEDDRKYLIGQVLEYVSSIRGIDMARIQNNQSNALIFKHMKKFDNEEHKELYEEIKDQLDTIFAYMNQLWSFDLDHDDRQELWVLQKQFISLSNAGKATKNIREDIEIIRNNTHPALEAIYYELADQLIQINRIVHTVLSWTPDQAEAFTTLIQQVASYRDNILTHVAPHIIQGNVGEMDVSSLINMTREITDGYKDIANASS